VENRPLRWWESGGAESGIATTALRLLFFVGGIPRLYSFLGATLGCRPQRRWRKDWGLQPLPGLVIQTNVDLGCASRPQAIGCNASGVGDQPGGKVMGRALGVADIGCPLQCLRHGEVSSRFSLKAAVTWTTDFTDGWGWNGGFPCGRPLPLQVCGKPNPSPAYPCYPCHPWFQLPFQGLKDECSGRGEGSATPAGVGDSNERGPGVRFATPGYWLQRLRRKEVSSRFSLKAAVAWTTDFTDFTDGWGWNGGFPCGRPLPLQVCGKPNLSPAYPCYPCHPWFQLPFQGLKDECSGRGDGSATPAGVGDPDQRGPRVRFATPGYRLPSLRDAVTLEASEWVRNPWNTAITHGR
jgi:hypothetical protein